MTRTAEKSLERVSHRQLDKFAERRGQLAEAALQTLSELGYARTSLREIAQNSEFSHGVLHYYFTDKVDLITHCVRQYKTRCIVRYEQIFDAAASAEDLRHRFAAGLAETMVNDTATHRLWYDLRVQALFEVSFRDDVAQIDQSLERMVWRIVSRLAEAASVSPALSPSASYAVLDGLFQQALLKRLSGDPGAGDYLEKAVLDVLDLLAPEPDGCGDR